MTKNATESYIRQVISCLPEVNDGDEAKIAERLIGTHHYRRVTQRGTQDIVQTVSDVRIQEEGSGLVQLALRNGLITPGEGLIGCFNLGRQTAIYFLVDASEPNPSRVRIIRASRGVMPSGGMQALLARLQNDGELRAAVGKRGLPNENTILSAILNRGYTQGRAIYGTTGFDFTHILNRHVECSPNEGEIGWLNTIAATATRHWGSGGQGWNDSLNGMVFFGGAAPLARVWVDDPNLNEGGYFRIPEIPGLDVANPAQFVDCIGWLPPGGLVNSGEVVVVDNGYGHKKYCNTAGDVGIRTSIQTRLRQLPRPSDLDEESVAIEYVSGPLGNSFIAVYGSSASDLTLNATSQVMQDKTIDAAEQILSCLKPVTPRPGSPASSNGRSTAVAR